MTTTASTTLQGDTLMMLGLDEIAETYGELRVVDPKSQARMHMSLMTYGQLAPVVVVDGAKPPFQIVDGFKRLRAVRAMTTIPHLTARRVALGAHAAKAAIVCLNRLTSRVSVLEEALVVRSLVRVDGLSQLEVATLFGRCPSWVCRRLGLVEKLCDEAVERMRIGLVAPATARELARLPRGNQPPLLECLDEHRLTSREAASVVARLLETPRPSWGVLLADPVKIIDEARAAEGKPPLERGLVDAIARAGTHCRSLASRLEAQAAAQPREVIEAARAALVHGQRLCRALGGLTLEGASTREAAPS